MLTFLYHKQMARFLRNSLEKITFSGQNVSALWEYIFYDLVKETFQWRGKSGGKRFILHFFFYLMWCIDSEHLRDFPFIPWYSHDMRSTWDWAASKYACKGKNTDKTGNCGIIKS